jgi:SAM-dependent methyltransferase
MASFLSANGIPVKGPALEIGTNAGMGLKVMTEAGWTDLTGIEINSKAIALMQELYPDVAAAVTVLNAPVEDAIRTLPDAHFELTWSKAVLLHIHPSSEWVFREMVRVTRSHLLAVESEDVRGMKLFPRNYRDVFEGLGMEQVAQTRMQTAPTYVARLFRHGAR